MTASGKKAKVRHTIAVDPRIIPLGSKVKIKGRWYTAEDKGGLIKGNRIDIFMNSHKETVKFGVKRLRVKIRRYKR